MRVLLVENDVPYGTSIGVELKAEAVRVDIAESGDDALYLMRHYDFGLVLLSMLLPDMGGTSLISRIRLAKHETPIIAISAARQARLKALAASADDMVERDIDQAELAARIRAIVRRSRGFSQSQLHVGGVILGVEHQDIVANRVRVYFTKKRFVILQLIVLRRNMIMTKQIIFSQSYGGMGEPEIKIIDLSICKIRSKLSKAGLPTVISTGRGRGYSVKDTGHEGSTITLVPPQPAQAERIFA